MTNRSQPDQSLAPFEALTMDLWQAICELPDRNSPEDEPEAAIVTLEELRIVVENVMTERGMSGERQERIASDTAQAIYDIIARDDFNPDHAIDIRKAVEHGQERLLAALEEAITPAAEAPNRRIVCKGCGAVVAQCRCPYGCETVGTVESCAKCGSLAHAEARPGGSIMSETPDAAPRCPWWVRWWHTRLRMMDINAVWARLLATAPTASAARQAWDLHVSLPGQEHWRCACGREAAQVFALVLWRVDAKAHLEDEADDDD